MKSLKNRMTIAALVALPIMVSASAMAADFVVARTAAVGYQIPVSKTFVVDQSFWGTSSSQAICGSVAVSPAPCFIQIDLNTKSDLTTTPISIKARGTLYVLKGDPTAPLTTLILPDQVVQATAISGNLTLNLSGNPDFGSGTAVLGGGKTGQNIAITLYGAGIGATSAHTGLPIFSGGTLEIDGTIVP